MDLNAKATKVDRLLVNPKVVAELEIRNCNTKFLYVWKKFLYSLERNLDKSVRNYTRCTVMD